MKDLFIFNAAVILLMQMQKSVNTVFLYIDGFLKF